MAIFKCKMCGGDLEINEKMTVGTCEYCGSTMTLPKDTDDKKANLFNRANHFRRNNDFDKAMTAYENILNEDNTDAEAHWGLVLCKYGIEYVEDPKTHERMPTCHRTQYESIFIDPDYKQAIANADDSARNIYEAEAKKIDSIQKGILEISSKEEPFDVFICYKETDEAGSRTKDSVIAQDIYYHLKEEGFKVFFSRITLEEKLGSAYEPYIFAALHSAKVMVVVGTKPEHFSSTWTKNEWSRFLALIKKGEKKVLIPAYRDFDPYDLPEEFSHLQAQDMGKIGFVQDLVRGIKKVVSNGEQKAATAQAPASQGNATTQSLLDRAYLCLETSDFSKADNLAEQVLNMDPRSASAYVVKLMVELKINQVSDLAQHSSPLDLNTNYQMTVRFADDKYRQTIEGYNQVILDRLDNERKEKIYQVTLAQKNRCQSEQEYISVAGTFRSIAGYKNADALAVECEHLADLARVAQEQEDEKRKNENEEEQARNAIKEIKKKKLIKIIAFTSLIILLILGLLKFILFPIINYSTATNLIAAKKYAKALYLLNNLKNYRDSEILFEQNRSLALKNPSIGDVVYLGKCEQDNKTSNGPENIAWRVLDIKDGKALLLSDKNIAYLDDYESSEFEWRTSTERSWLNSSFLYGSFDNQEIGKIANTKQDKSFNYVEDKIFLLSDKEVEQYFPNEVDRISKNTEFVARQQPNYEQGNDDWTLRTKTGNFAAQVNEWGKLIYLGKGSYSSTIRPAIWIIIG